MEYVNDVNIMEAVIHVLDKNNDEPILNEYKLELTDDIYKFLYKHIERAFKNENLRYAKFNEENGIVKEVTQSYLNRSCKDFIGISKDIARQMFYVMKGNSIIESCDLIVLSISTNIGEMIGILKLDHGKTFTHKIEFINNKTEVFIKEHQEILPTSAARIKKCAFIRLSNNKNFDLMVLDKKKKIKKDDEYSINYFTNNFLGCTVINNERDNTKRYLNYSEYWIRNNIINDADKQKYIRNVIRNSAINNEIININEIVKNFDYDEAQNYKTFINTYVDEEFKVDKTYLEKKLKRIRLKVDNDIDIYINNEGYEDSSKFEITKNGDGTINMIIKNINNYIEK